MKVQYLARCPACSARLPMNDSHMEAAQGNVSCGRCNTAFYAPDHLLRGDYPPKAKLQSAPTLSMPFDLADSDEQPQIEQTVEPNQDSRIDQELPVQLDNTEGNNSVQERIISSHDMRPADIRKRRLDHTSGTGTSKKWLWIPAILIVLLALVLQLFIVNAPTWGKHPMLRGLYSQICATMLCELPIDIKPVSLNIEIAGYRKLENGSYEIKALLTNWAYYDQPMPVIRVSFVDLSETERYSKTLIPEDYIPGYQKEVTKLGAEQQFNFTIRIDDLEGESKHLFPRMELVSY